MPKLYTVALSAYYSSENYSVDYNLFLSSLFAIPKRTKRHCLLGQLLVDCALLRNRQFLFVASRAFAP